MSEVKFFIFNFVCNFLGDPMGEGEGSDIPPKNVPFDSSSNLNSKKLARQLDFNAVGGTPVTVPLPEQPQQSPAILPPATLPPLPSAKLG